MLNDVDADVGAASGRLPAAAMSADGSAVPASGEALQVAPGVLWIRMPLPFVLDHVNVWALRDGDGWTLVDTGMCTSRTATVWNSVLLGPLASEPIMRVVVTHMHPDHIGMAGWFTKRLDCRLWTTRLEYLNCRSIVADTGRRAPKDAVRFYQAAGWDEDDLESYRTRFGSFGKSIAELPDSYRRVVDGEAIVIGGRTWRAIVVSGHSPEHLCLYCPELRVFISGDAVLPKISSNVSVFPMEPDADPLTEWLSSMATLRDAVPDDVLVLPSHHKPVHGLHARLDELRERYLRQMRRLIQHLAQPRRAADAISALFSRNLGPELRGMATGETLAFLAHAMNRGLATRTTDESGIHWYQRTVRALSEVEMAT